MRTRIVVDPADTKLVFGKKALHVESGLLAWVVPYRHITFAALDEDPGGPDAWYVRIFLADGGPMLELAYRDTTLADQHFNELSDGVAGLLPHETGPL